MSITFACDCGKQFTVADDFAGKRTKCPACASPLTVPAANEPAPEEAPKPDDGLSDEDKAFRALAEGPDPEPAAATRPPPPAPRLQSAHDPPPPTPLPAKKRGPTFATRAAGEERDRGGGIHISPATLGGLGMMVLALIWFGLGWAGGRIYFYPPILFLFGLVAFVRGLLGYSED